MKRITLFTSLAVIALVLGAVNIGSVTTHANGGTVTASPQTISINQGTLITANFSGAGQLPASRCQVTPANGTGHYYSSASNVGDSWQPAAGDWWYYAPAVGANGSSDEYDGPSDPGSGNGWTTSAQRGWNAISFVVYPRSTTTYSITCTYDAPPARSRINGTPGTYSGSVTVTVNPSDLSAACSVNPTSATTGQQVTWSASANGGVGGYNYSWSGDDNLSGAGIQNIVSYLTTGTKQASVTVTDLASTKGIWEKAGSVPGSYTSGATASNQCNFGSGQPIPLCDNPTADSKQGVIDNPTNTCWFSPNGGVEVDQYVCVQAPAGYIQNDTATAECSDSVAISAPASADLSAGSVSPQTAIVGQSITFASNATNNGNGTSGSFPILFQVQNGDSFNSGFIDGLAAGGTATGYASYTFSAPGTYQVQACANRDSNNNEVTQDSNPNNDCSGFSSVTVYGVPTASLTISPTSISSGDSATLTWQCASDATSCTGTNFDTGGAMSGSVSISPSQTTTYTVWANGPGGTTSSSQTLTVGAKRYPDLTATPGYGASGYVGANIGLSGTIYNIGNASTGSSFNNMIQMCGANGDCSSFAQNIGTGVMGALAAGDSQNAGATANFSSPGTYSYRLCADYNAAWASSIDEGTGEGNNCSSWQSISVTYAPATDLTAGLVSPSYATAGTPVTFSADAYNIGNADSGAFPVLFQIQNGDVFDSGYVSVAAGGANTATASYTFNSPGTYQIHACVNRNTSWQGIVSESNYDNDCGDWTTVTVNPGAQPDLTPGPASDVTVTLGDPIPLTGTVTNIGAADAGSFKNLFVTNMNADQTAWNTRAEGSSVDSLAVGATGNFSTTLPADTFTAPGSYAYTYCVNLDSAWGNTISESNLQNNCTNWAAINVLPVQVPQSDLTPGDAPNVTATLGDSVTITGSVTNIGVASTGASFKNAFKTNPGDNGWITLKNGTTVDALDAGASQSVSVTFPASTFPHTGNYQYQYCVDEDANNGLAGSITESNEGNNCSTVGTIEIDPAVDNTVTNNNPPPITPTNPQTCTGPLNLGVSATPTRVESGSSAKLTWTAENMNQTCTLTGTNGTAITLPTDMCNENGNNADTGAITKQTIFTLDCGTAGKKQTVINVVPKFNEF